jgi:hypothetical protein
MRSSFYYLALIFLLPCLCSKETYAQKEQEKVIDTILHLDSLFWNVYNSCDTTRFKDFFTADVEFYHDKGGATIGIEALNESFKKNLCSNSDYHLRREAVEGTVKVYTLHKGDEIYGAVITGEHLFYAKQREKSEFLDGQASFTHLWLLKNGEWRMSRVLSYNHHEPDYVSKRKEITIGKNKLEELAGSYKAPKTGEIRIQREDEHLLMLIGDKHYVIYPESETVFFSKERDLTFEFIKDVDKVNKMIVREKGEVVEEAMFQK